MLMLPVGSALERQSQPVIDTASDVSVTDTA